jgi:hypothetical protein
LPSYLHRRIVAEGFDHVARYLLQRPLDRAAIGCFAAMRERQENAPIGKRN